MPIYEYECASCGQRHEVIQKISDQPLKDCPECGQPALQKLVSAAGFRLKGSGWYVTDFRDKGKKKEGAAGEKKADAKPEAKPEVTSEPKGDSAGKKSGTSGSGGSEAA